MQDARFRLTGELRCELRVIGVEGTFDVVAEEGVIEDDTLTIAGEEASVEEIRGALLKVDNNIDVDPNGVRQMNNLLDRIEEGQ